MKNERGSNIIRMVAGAYLIYLAYSMVKSLLSGEGGQQVLVIIAAVVFVVMGGLFLAWGLRGTIQMRNDSSDDVIEGEASEIEDQQVRESDEPTEAGQAAKTVPEDAPEAAAKEKE